MYRSLLWGYAIGMATLIILLTIGIAILKLFKALLQMKKDDEEYKNLLTLTPKYTSENKINASLGEWTAKRESALSTISSLEKQIKELLDEHNKLNQELPFPSDGTQLMQSLLIKINILVKEIEQFKLETTKKATLKDKQEGKLNTKAEQFNKDFPNQELILFTQPLHEAAELLNDEKIYLTDRKRFIDQQLDRVHKELQQIEEAGRGLDRFIEGHHFQAPDISAQPLTTDELQDFTYQRKKYVRLITDELSTHKAYVEETKKVVEQAKRSFREFCLHHISDIKLQQMAINGV